MKNLGGVRNTTIDLFRVVMAVLIVAMHSSALLEINQYLSYFLTQMISRLAVPFFAFTAGRFFFGSTSLSEKRYTKALHRYIHSYSIWSCIYFLFLSVVRTTSGETLTVSYLLETFFLKGFYHLWYLLASIYTILLLYLFRRVKNIHSFLYRSRFVFLTAGILLLGYRNIAPFLKSIGTESRFDFVTKWLLLFFPFFISGYSFPEKQKTFTSIKHCEILLPTCIALMILEIAFGKMRGYMASTTLCIMTYPTVYLILLFSDKHPHIGSEKCAKYASGISSFMYFGHILFILLLQKAGASETPTFLFTVLVTAITGALIVKSDNAFLKRLI